MTPDQPFDLANLRNATETYMATLNTRAAVEHAMECVRETNRYITEKAPWLSKDQTHRETAVRTTLEAVYVFAHFLSPYLPATSAVLFKRLHTAARPIPQLSPAFDNLAPGTPVDVGDILFAKVALPEPRIVSAPGAPPVEHLSASELEAAVTAQGTRVRQLKEVRAPFAFCLYMFNCDVVLR